MVLDPRIKDLMEQPDEASDVNERPLPTPSTTPAPRRPKQLTGLPADSQAVSAGLAEARARAEVMALDAEMGITAEEMQEPTPVAQVAEPTGFWDHVLNPAAAAKGTALGMLQFGQNITNLTREQYEKVVNGREVPDLPSWYRGKADGVKAWAQTAEIATPIGVGMGVGAFFGPIGIGVGAVVGGAVGAFVQDPTNGNLSTALKDTRLKDYPVVGDVINAYAHKPGDTALERRLKNLFENGLLDATGAAVGAVAGGLAKSQSARYLGRTLKDEYDLVKGFITKKYPNQKPVTEAAANQSAAQVARTVPDAAIELPEDQVASQAGVDIAANTMREAGELGDEVVRVTPPEQLAPPNADPLHWVQTIDEYNKAKYDSVMLEQLELEAKSTERSERVVSKQRSLFKGRPPEPNDPRLDPQQLSLFNTDDVDIAGFGHDPKQRSFFDEQLEKNLPEQFELTEKEFIDQELRKQLPESAPVRGEADEIPLSPAEKDPATIKMTFADESLTEKMETLRDVRAKYYADKAETTAPVPRAEAINQASKNLQDPAYRLKMLTLPAEHVPNEVEMAAMQQLYVESFVDFDGLLRKVMDGSANDLEIQAFEEASKNWLHVSGKYYSQGTELSRSFGIRTMLREYAKADNPVALALIGREGKMKAIRELIANAGGRDFIQDEAKVFAEFVAQAAKPKGSREAVEAGGMYYSKQVVEDAAEQVGRLLKSSDANYIMDAAGEVALKSRGRRVVDAMTGYMFDNMLLHYGPIVNTVFGAPLDVGLKVGHNYAYAALAGVRGKGVEAAIRLDKANRYAMALAKNLTNGLKMAAREFRIGPNPNATDIVVSSSAEVPLYLKELAARQLTQVPPDAMRTNSALKSFASQARGWTLGLGRRVLTSWDAFVSTLGYNASLESEYMERGLRAGLEGQDLENYIQGGVRKPDPNLHDRALLDGAKFSYRAELEMEPLRMVEEALHRFPVAKIFVPFFRSYGNAVERTVEYFPGLTYLLKSSRAGNQEEILAKQMAGGGALLLTMMAFREDVVENPEVPGVFYPQFVEPVEGGKGNKGRIPLGFKNADGGWTKLPLGGAVGKYLQIAGYLNMAAEHMDEEEYQASFHAAMYSLGSIMSVQEQFRTADLIWEIAKDPKNAGNELQKLGASIVDRTIPAYRIGKEINQATDPFSVSTAPGGDDPIDYVLSVVRNRAYAVVPGMSENLPPETNMLGEPLNSNVGKGAPNLLTGTKESSAVMGNLLKISEFSMKYPNSGYETLTLQKLPQTLEVEGYPIQLTNKAYFRFKVLAGGMDPDNFSGIGPGGMTLRQALEDAFKKNSREFEGISLNRISANDYNRLVADVKEVISAYKTNAKKAMANDPEVREAILLREKAKLEQKEKNIPNVFGNI